MLQAAHLLVNRWLSSYEVAGVYGLKTKGVGRPVRQPKAFICKVLIGLLENTLRTLGYQRSGYSSRSRSESWLASRCILHHQTLVVKAWYCLASDRADAVYT